MRDDKDSVLDSVIKDGHKRIPSKLGNIFTNRRKHNILNNIFIFDATKFKRYAHDAGIKMSDYVKRQILMTNLSAILIVLVDPLYKSVSIYANGIESYTDLSYNQCRDNSKSDKIGIVEVLEAMNKNTLPKF
jgi:hypothetical protein